MSAKSASVLAKLKNVRDATEGDFNQILSRYVGLRFLARIAASKHANDFLVKGATLFLIWGGDVYRPTRDIDLLGFNASDPEALASVMKEICTQDVGDDGIDYDPNSVQAAEIREGTAYGGIRCTIQANIGSAKEQLQIDIGFGDAVNPEPEMVELPRILEEASIHQMKAYRFETAIAEKFQAMVELGLANSRMKDFYDILYISKHNEFNGEDLGKALTETFKRRRTDLPTDTPLPFSEEFWSDKQVTTRWSAFIRKNDLDSVPLKEICQSLIEFLMPVCKVLATSEDFKRTWDGRKWN